MTDSGSLLRLLSVPGVGPQRVRQLVSRFGSARAVFEASVLDLVEVEGIDEKIARAVRGQSDERFSEAQVSMAEKHGVRLLSYWDPDYPDLLKSIHDPPVLMYTKGPLDWKLFTGIAVVGTRFPSTYGRQVSEQLSEELSLRGVTVVSGLARGVDTAAHKGALRGRGSTVAVLGSGLDVVYPPENRKLYLEIMESGAVVSEFAMGAPPEAQHFPRRNRIISGLSRGTVVVEAGDKSGALLTSDLALEQNRDVFAVPGNIISPKSRGTNRLIRDGAKLVTGVEDIISEFPNAGPFAAGGRTGGFDPGQLTGDEKKVWDALSREPEHIDLIARQSGVSTSEAMALLLSMELKSCVRQITGMRFMRIE
jgi:DNA processing protein